MAIIIYIHFDYMYFGFIFISDDSVTRYNQNCNCLLKFLFAPSYRRLCDRAKKTIFSCQDA